MQLFKEMDYFYIYYSRFINFPRQIRGENFPGETITRHVCTSNVREEEKEEDCHEQLVTGQKIGSDIEKIRYNIG